jgi:NADPH-dependent curcumin reductase CurA
MRGWVNAAANYSQPVAIDAVMRAMAAGDIVASKHPDYAVGERVIGWFGWQDYAVSDGASVVRKIAESDLPISLSLGILGINGVTAYLALMDIGEPKPGDTVVVSTAAGSVGSAVGQLAKLAGARTVGIAGGPEKVALCRDAFGYDVALDYKAAEPLLPQLQAACPAGADVYFDNTSGAISDAVVSCLAVNARVVICGTASVPAWEPPPLGPRMERAILTKRLRVQGFVMFDHMHRYIDVVARLAGLVRAGRLAYREEILDGIESCPDAIAGLYRGENLGKRLIRLL